MIRLEFLHGGFGRRIPLTGGWSWHVMLADQRVLDLFCPFGLDLALSWGKFVLFRRLMVQGVTGGRSTMSPRCERG
jgi:hypothetical protein